LRDEQSHSSAGGGAAPSGNPAGDAELLARAKAVFSPQALAAHRAFAFDSAEEGVPHK